MDHSPAVSSARGARAALSLVVGVAALGLLGAAARAQVTRRVSIDSAGNEANGTSDLPVVSADGRFVAFQSGASNLVPGDTNGLDDVFVYDRLLGTIEIASVSSSGELANRGAGEPAISGDGRYVAFHSSSTNLAPDTNGIVTDVFVRDRTLGTTELVSVDSSGKQDSIGFVRSPSISLDGRFVAFWGDARLADTEFDFDVMVRDRVANKTELASVLSGDAEDAQLSGDGRFVAYVNDDLQIYVFDRVTKTTEMVSVDDQGTPGNSGGLHPSLDATGRFVAFESLSNNLVPSDTNNKMDVFLRDRTLQVTRRISVDAAGNQADDASGPPLLSSDGRYVAFASAATSLVPNDANHVQDVFVKDLLTDEVELASVDDLGQQGDHGSGGDLISGLVGLSGDGTWVAFESPATNLVPKDTNGLTDVFVHAPVTTRFVGEATFHKPVHFEVANANASQVGHGAIVLLSCSGTTGFPIPGGRIIHLVPDVCMSVGLSNLWMLSGTVDPTGTVETATFRFPPVAPGFTIYAAAVTIDPATNGIVSITAPMSFTTE
jgi:Tol biopolymer transport system component